MKRGGPQHPKTIALSRRLKISRFSAVGILECLWHFAAGYAHAGDIGRFTNPVIAEAVGWDGDADVLISALIAERLVDPCQCHRLRIHDWRDHADQTVSRVLAKQNRGFIGCYDDPSTVLAPSQHETSQPSPSLALPSLALPSPEPPAASAALDLERLVNLLSQEPGTKDDKLAWLRSEITVIQLLAEEDHPDDQKRRMAAIRSRVVRHWKQHQKPQAALQRTNGSGQYLRRVQSEDRSETTDQDRADLARIKAEIAAEEAARRTVA